MEPERSRRHVDALTGTLLPRGPFRRPADGADLDLRAGRGPLVLFLMHSERCEQCRTHLDTLREYGAEWSHWGARVFGVAPAAHPRLDPQQRSGAADAAILLDREQLLADGRVGIVVADEWGEIHFAQSAGEGHAIPTADELIEWARFVSIQCPECEGPEGEWRSV